MSGFIDHVIIQMPLNVGDPFQRRQFIVNSVFLCVRPTIDRHHPAGLTGKREMNRR